VASRSSQFQHQKQNQLNQLQGMIGLLFIWGFFRLDPDHLGDDKEQNPFVLGPVSIDDAHPVVGVL
jgi:hypothetical protein